MAEPAVPDEAPVNDETRVPDTIDSRTDRSHWNWLLVVPIVLPLLTLLYNAEAPRLLGFPKFYWLQFAFILVGVTTTSIVYQMTKRGR